jgi:hypothetical protein
MKLALIILGIFFLSLTVRSRELSLSERGVLLGLHKTSEIKSFMIDKIIKTDLSMRDYIGFLALRRSCDPVNILVRHIEKQGEELGDQSKGLTPLMSACEKGTLGLGHLYIGQNH